MSEIVIRKRVTLLEEIFHEGGKPAAQPLRRGAILVRSAIRSPDVMWKTSRGSWMI